MLKKDNIRHILSLFHLIFFCLILTNNILFVHSHKLANGQIIVHAHPFFPQDDGTPMPHQHSSNDYISLGKVFQPGLLLSEIPYIDFQVTLPELLLPYKVLIILFEGKSLFHYNHRGPPLF